MPVVPDDHVPRIVPVGPHGGRPMTGDADRSRVRSSALRVGLLVGIATAAVLTIGVTALIGILTAASRPERHGEGGLRPGRGDGDEIVVDLEHTARWIILFGVIGVILMAIIGWLAARWAVRPLAAALTAQRRFVADASHELRTPLTALTSRIQILQRRHERGDPIDDTIASLRRDAGVMDAVLTDMLLLTEGTPEPVPPEGTDADACVREAARTVEPVAAAHGVTLVIDSAPGPRAAIPSVTFTRLVVVLLDNAAQHAPRGTGVTAGVAAANGLIDVRVHDHGSGVVPGDEDRIFDRFARGGETGRRRGFGLGLALAREAAERFGGTVTLEQTSPAGSTFLLRVPAA